MLLLKKILMKLTKLFTVLFITLCSCTIVLTSCSEKKSAIPALLERKKSVGSEEEKAHIDSFYNKAVTALQKNPDDLQQYINLASVYINEGRITGNNSYYDNAAMLMLNKVTESKTGNKDITFQALNIKSAILLNVHQFKDALEVAKQGVAINTYNAGIYGALVDANVEMGNYDAAVKACDQMIAIRPDLRSYSRASYMRQIYGQNAGAIEAMKMAVESGQPGSENTEWARTTLGDLYLSIGKLDSATYEYRTSLTYRPDYPFAMIGLARVEKAKKNYDAAIELTKNTIKIRSEVAFVSLLGDLYALKGDATKAKETRADVVDLLNDAQKEEKEDALVKRNANRELANAYLSSNKIDEALKYANNDLVMRPENIDANELAAWIYYLKNDNTNAKLHADKMMLTNCKNAEKLYKAGVIYAAAGENEKGQKLIAEAMATSPYVDQEVINHTRQAVALNK